MQKQPYKTPVIKKLGSVKDLTEGSGGNTPEAAGSFMQMAPPAAPTAPQ